MFSYRPVFFVTFIALTLTTASCTWREGRYVYYRIYDADTDDDADERDGDCEGQYPAWISAADLEGRIHSDDPELELIVDIRPLEACHAGHIRGALCNPWDDGFAEPVPELESGDLVLYDYNGEIVEGAASSLPSSCSQPVLMLEQGFGGWEASGFEIETSE